LFEYRQEVELRAVLDELSPPHQLLDPFLLGIPKVVLQLLLGKLLLLFALLLLRVGLLYQFYQALVVVVDGLLELAVGRVL
jgi:hypothetical protein